MDAVAKRPRRLRAFESEIHPSHKSCDLYSGYLAPAEGLYRLFGLPASHSIQRKMLSHFSVAAPAIVDRLCSAGCLSQPESGRTAQTETEVKNGKAQLYPTRSPAAACSMMKPASGYARRRRSPARTVKSARAAPSSRRVKPMKATCSR